jgi:hypothetical protein
MNYPQYTEIGKAKDWMAFRFLTDGPKGQIWKIVQFAPVGRRGYYSLAFGDLKDDGELDDNSISNNGDTIKILATVAATVTAFLDRYPRCRVIFQGNTAARTRLYRMAINASLPKLETAFVIEGLERLEDGLLYLRKFNPLGNYEAFIVRRRRIAEYPNPPP